MPTIDTLRHTPAKPLPVRKAAVEYLRSWHNDAHPGGFDLCREEPCAGLTHLLIHTPDKDELW